VPAVAATSGSTISFVASGTLSGTVNTSDQTLHGPATITVDARGQQAPILENGDGGVWVFSATTISGTVSASLANSSGTQQCVLNSVALTSQTFGLAITPTGAEVSYASGPLPDVPDCSSGVTFLVSAPMQRGATDVDISGLDVHWVYPPLPARPAAAGSTGASPVPPARSTIASSLVPATQAFPLNARTLFNAIVTVLAMILITFPAQLFNRTLDENYDQIAEIGGRRAPMLISLRRAMVRRRSQAGWAGFATVVVVGSVIGGFIDPKFGLNGRSAETLVGVIGAFTAAVAVTGASSWLHRAISGRDRKWSPHAIPAGLLVAIACVVVSRMTHFQPGYLYGVVAGLAFTATLSSRDVGLENTVSAVAVLVVAVVAWIIWTPINHAASGLNPNPLLLVADTFLAGLFVSGVVGTVINLVPLEFLSGASILRWRKVVWAVLFSIAVFLLIEVMVLPAARSSRLGNAPFITTILLFVGFGALSISFHRFFASRSGPERFAAERRADLDETVVERPLGIGIPPTAPGGSIPKR
jgi:hypothetical protein